MSPLVPAALLGWLLVAPCAFLLLPPRRAVIADLLIGWMFLPAWRLAHDMDQSRRARALGGIGLIALVAFAVMSLASGIAYSSIATIPTALLLGLVRGLEATPGRTFVDEPEEETARWT